MTPISQIQNRQPRFPGTPFNLRHRRNLRTPLSPNVSPTAMKTFPSLTAALLAAGTASAALVTETYTPTIVTTAIADNQPVLTSFLHSVTTSAILSLSEVTITFELRGTTPGDGWASDMFASFLRSPVGVAPTVSDPSAVLLNRVGVSGGDPLGFGYDGWQITLRDQAPPGDPALTDIHNQSFISGVLTGTFQPDGRTGPTDTLRPAMLSAFNGGAGNGDWRLNLGDLSAGGTMQLVSWSFTLTGEDSVSPIPEAGTWAAGLGLAALAGATWWRARRRA
jgi:MYXO-CTERM domain-containing protein